MSIVFGEDTLGSTSSPLYKVTSEKFRVDAVNLSRRKICINSFGDLNTDELRTKRSAGGGT